MKLKTLILLCSTLLSLLTGFTTPDVETSLTYSNSYLSDITSIPDEFIKYIPTVKEQTRQFLEDNPEYLEIVNNDTNPSSIDESVIERLTVDSIKQNIQNVEAFKSLNEGNLENLVYADNTPVTVENYTEKIFNSESFAIIDISIISKESKSDLLLDSINFPDPALRKRLIKALNIQECQPISPIIYRDLILNGVRNTSDGLRSLQGLENFTELKTLKISYTDIDSMEDIKYIGNLEVLRLDLTGNDLSSFDLNHRDFTTLQRNLRSLNLSSCLRLNMLRNLTLNELYLRGSNIHVLTQFNNVSVSNILDLSHSGLYSLKGLNLIMNIYGKASLYIEGVKLNEISTKHFPKYQVYDMSQILTVYIAGSNITEDNFFSSYGFEVDWSNSNPTIYYEGIIANVQPKNITKEYTGESITISNSNAEEYFYLNPEGVDNFEFTSIDTGKPAVVGNNMIETLVIMSEKAWEDGYYIFSKWNRLEPNRVSYMINITPNTQTSSSVVTNNTEYTYGDEITLTTNLQNRTLVKHEDLDTTLLANNEVIDQSTHSTDGSIKTFTYKPQATGSITYKLTTPGNKNIQGIS